MANLGMPVTAKFILGAAELRISLMSAAGRQLPNQSVGVIEKWGYAVENQFVDLRSGFPKTLLDKALVESVGKLTFTTREYTLRNMNVLAGGAVAAYPTAGGDLVGTVDTTAHINAAEVTLVLTADVAFQAGMLVSVYSTTDPTKVTVSTVDSYTSGTKTLVLKTGQGTLVEFAQNEVVKVSNLATFGGGSSGSVNYFSAQLIYLDRPTSRPVVVDFWKCATDAGVTIESTGDDFASQDWSIGLLVPVASEYGVSGPLYHQAAAIPSNPLFRVAGPLDIL
jgi:hypothetical protein